MRSERADMTFDKLECGASLAELEHGIDDRPFGSEIKDTCSLNSLRESLAADILTTSKPFETFTSPFETPASMKSSSKFLTVPLVYCDHTASNRPVKSIEDYMQKTCLPLYGNTHTNTSITGSQSTAFVAEARQIVAEVTNAKVNRQG